MQSSAKENLARFLESKDRENLKELLKNNTGEYNFLDFKEKLLETPKLAKHILGFANAGGGILIFGVKEEKDGDFTPVGIDKFEDKTQMEKELEKYLPYELKYEIGNFEYKDPGWGKLAGKKFQVISVEDTPEYLPFLAKKTFGDVLYKNRVYIRGKVNTEEATHEELQDIVNRRISTNANTTSEEELRAHLRQLEILYSFVNEYGNYFKSYFGSIAGFSQNLAMLYRKNPKYPKEDFESFVLKMIKYKKKIIENIVKM